MWQEGNPIEAIAEKLDVSHRTVYRDLGNYGIVPSSPVTLKVPDLPLNNGNVKPAPRVPAIPANLVPEVLITNATILAEAWINRASEQDSAAAIYLKVADHLAKLVGAYAPEKRIQGNFKLEPPEPMTIPADVVQATGEIIGELDIKGDDDD